MSKEAIEYIEQLLTNKLKRKKRWKYPLYKRIEYIDYLNAFYFVYNEDEFVDGSRIEVIEASKMVWNDVRNTEYANEVMALMLCGNNA